MTGSTPLREESPTDVEPGYVDRETWCRLLVSRRRLQRCEAPAGALAVVDPRTGARFLVRESDLSTDGPARRGSWSSEGWRRR